MEVSSKQEKFFMVRGGKLRENKLTLRNLWKEDGWNSLILFSGHSLLS